MNIIIVKYKSPEDEERCIESVRKFTDLEKHTLTVFDNAPQNINLGKLWNQLIEQSKDENICLLNSDTIVEEGWERLEEGLGEGVGAVGPITNKCGGKQKDLKRADLIERINDLSGFCYLFKKSVWEKVGRFPEDMPFYGQETVFNRKLEDYGYKLMVDRRVFIWHEKGASWFKAKERGEVGMDQVHMGAFHYRNYVRRLGELRKYVKQGTRIAFIGAGPNNPFPTFIGIDQFISDFLGENGKHFRLETLLRDILDYKPDIVIVVSTRIEKDAVRVWRGLRKNGIKMAWYYMDYRSPFLTDLWLGCPPLPGVFDRIFITAKELLPDWQSFHKTPVSWLTQGTIQQPVRKKSNRFLRVVHIGDTENEIHADRKRVLAEIGKEHSITNFNSFNREERIKISEESYSMYSVANFSIDIPISNNGYTSDRLYHILGSGGCALSWKNDLPFVHGEHLFWFETPEEAIKIIDETTPEQREKIKENAFLLAQSEHLYKDRYIEIIKQIV